MMTTIIVIIIITVMPIIPMATNAILTTITVAIMTILHLIREIEAHSHPRIITKNIIQPEIHMGILREIEIEIVDLIRAITPIRKDNKTIAMITNAILATIAIPIVKMTVIILPILAEMIIPVDRQITTILLSIDPVNVMMTI